jgi:hypothetical protein
VAEERARQVRRSDWRAFLFWGVGGMWVITAVPLVWGNIACACMDRMSFSRNSEYSVGSETYEVNTFLEQLERKLQQHIEAQQRERCSGD